MGKNEELQLIEEYFSLEDMFDKRTVELFKIKNNIKGDLTIDVFTTYINKYIPNNLDLISKCSILE